MILVTGASGFVGSTVVWRAVAQGRPVRAMVRPAGRLDLLAGLPAESLVRADMEDAPSLTRAAEGCDAVVHCAATTSQGAPDEALSRRTNVAGTAALLEACRGAGARRFILISSQSAHPDNPSVYGRTKLEQEQVVRAATDVEWTILRPSIIYGPRSRGIFDKMAAYCRKLPVVPIVGSGREPMRPIHVEDVAGAVLDCLDHPVTIGRAYDLGGADAMTFNEFIAEIRRAMGRPVRLFHIPLPLALAMARVLSALSRNPPLTPDNVRGIATARPVDISAAQRDFGFAPRGFAEGLRQALGADALTDTSNDGPARRHFACKRDRP